MTITSDTTGVLLGITGLPLSSSTILPAPIALSAVILDGTNAIQVTFNAAVTDAGGDVTAENCTQAIPLTLSAPTGNGTTVLTYQVVEVINIGDRVLWSSAGVVIDCFGVTNVMTIGFDNNRYGYRDPAHAQPMGALVPNNINGNTVWTLFLNSINDLIIIGAGSAGGEQVGGANSIDFSAAGNPSPQPVSLVWSAPNLRYEATDAGMTSYIVGIGIGNDVDVKLVAIP